MARTRGPGFQSSYSQMLFLLSLLWDYQVGQNMDSTIALSSMSMLIQKIPSAPFLGETGVSGRNESKKNHWPRKVLGWTWDTPGAVGIGSGVDAA